MVLDTPDLYSSGSFFSLLGQLALRVKSWLSIISSARSKGKTGH